MPNPIRENLLPLMNNKLLYRLDWWAILCYLLLISFGLVNIYSNAYNGDPVPLFNTSNIVGKQLMFFIICLILLLPTLYLNPILFEHLAFTIFTISVVLLLGLFLFGTKISGATSWYNLGGIRFQPSEFTKISVSLLIAYVLSGIDAHLKRTQTLIKFWGIILLPMVLIVAQPDPGSALVFLGLVFVLIREGGNFGFILIGFYALFLFLLTIVINPINTSLIVGFLFFIFLYFFGTRRAKRKRVWPYFILLFLSVGFSFTVNFIFNEVFQQRHRDRINLVLGLVEDNQGIGYNINQSKIAIGSGAFTGKGFLEGSQTKGGFVPEQHTDFIFSTVGEEWGFIGSFGLVLLYTLFIARILFRAEKHTHTFSRIVSYSFASILFVHFGVNIGMTLGLVPTIGIPLPLISYGGSSLLAFSLFFFIYLNLDANRLR